MGISQNKLTVKITGVKSSEGNISIGVYTSADGFLKPDSLYTGVFAKSESGTTTAVIEDLPNGSYALAVFHDENANEKLDTNFIGIPKEPLGFSKGKLKTFGPPSFEECVFKVEGDIGITVPIN